MKDSVYANPFEELGPFTFNDDVAQVFPDMIRRSVPGYGQLVGGAGLLAARHAQPNSVLYDLGTSLGATALSLSRHVRTPDTRIIGVDNSAAMIERARELLVEGQTQQDIGVDLLHADIRDVQFQPTSVVCLNLTLQFIPEADRDALIQRLYDATLPGGILIMAEKVTFDDPSMAQWVQEVYWDFKRANGYSELEIAQKRTALENVMIPETPQAHQKRLTHAGYRNMRVWFQTLNFMGWVAFK